MLNIDEKTGLVLEGGGMRGVFTCGVLDYLMDNKIGFPYTVGVSAGASMACPTCLTNGEEESIVTSTCWLSISTSVSVRSSRSVD